MERNSEEEYRAYVDRKIADYSTKNLDTLRQSLTSSISWYGKRRVGERIRDFIARNERRVKRAQANVQLLTVGKINDVATEHFRAEIRMHKAVLKYWQTEYRLLKGLK